MSILFIVAHPDDEAFGPAGTISKLAKSQDVLVVAMCNGARPTQESVCSNRQINFYNSCKMMRVEGKIIGKWSDLKLDYREATITVEEIIGNFKPNTVYTHNISDINKDHRILADAVLAACRPKPKTVVNELYFFEVPSSTDWTFNRIEPTFKPNTYRDITDYIELKKQVASLYSTEIYEFPDARSIEAIETLSKYRGYQVGLNHAEAFQLVFSRD